MYDPTKSPCASRLTGRVLRDVLKTKYDGKLEKKYDGPAHEVVSRIFRGLSGKKIIAPTTFRRYETFDILLEHCLTFIALPLALVMRKCMASSAI
jgi:hypothetical protein